MNIVLRKAVSDDIPKIEELLLEMLKTIYHTDDPGNFETDYLKKFFTGSGDWICVAEDGNEIVAFLSIEVYRDDDYIYLDDFSVSEKYRNSGIGTSMIRTAEDFAEKSGISDMVLHVEKANEGAFRLYSKLGFSIADEQGSRFRMVKTIVH